MGIIAMSFARKNHPRLVGGGFTLIDVMGSVLIIGLALVAVVGANSRSMTMLKSSRQAATASKCLQQRIEQIRTYNWTEVTDSTAMQALYSTPPLPSVELPGFWEQVTVSSYTPPIPPAPAPTPAPPFLQIARNSDGSVTPISDNTDLVSGAEVRVDVQINWAGSDGRTRTRETSVIIANGGVGR